MVIMGKVGRYEASRAHAYPDRHRLQDGKTIPGELFGGQPAVQPSAPLVQDIIGEDGGAVGRLLESGGHAGAARPPLVPEGAYAQALGSKRSRFMTLFQAATKSWTNFSWLSAQA